MERPDTSFGSSEGNRVRDIAGETRRYFDTRNSSFRFDKLLGWGAAGVVCRVVERGVRPSRGRARLGATPLSRRLVVKRAIGPEAEAELRNEVAVLKRFRGAEHIVRLVASHSGAPQTSGLLDESKRLARLALRATRRVWRGSPWTSNYDSLLKGISGPVLIVEYLENGSLGSLLARLMGTDILLPNRILWSFCLCVVRACIAHAYPPNGDDGTADSPENIDRRRAPVFLGHGDIHEHNIMIGDRGIEFEEHNLIPALKLIDFGRAEESQQAFTRMVYDLWLEILALITRTSSARHRIGTYQGFRTRAVEIQHENEAQCPEGNGAAYPTLDDGLRHFLARCTAVDRDMRLSLTTMFIVAYVGATKPAIAYGPHEELESDAAVERLLSRLIFDADP
ncbi:hypothetical protein GGR51DRAFT_562128 [Nemania sp. FL0031]|nr:hypothetical protein GGR51DRAFT_562128 [Nemania sp. FL0031]